MKELPDWSKEEKKALERLMKTLDEFEALSDQLPVSYMKMFLEIALNPGLGPTDYAQRLNKIKGPASRIINSLSSYPRRDEKTYELVEKFNDSMDQRKTPIHLTSRGVTLIKKILKAQGL